MKKCQKPVKNILKKMTFLRIVYFGILFAY